MDQLSYSLSVVIPSYNEENGIAGVVEKTYDVLSSIPDLAFEIIVIDDGSTDETASRVPPRKASIIKHPKNFGYGRSILTGMEKARFAFVAILDADGTYDPMEFHKMIPQIKVFDMIIGARENINETFLAAQLRKVLKGVILFFTHQYSPDPNSGMRVFNRDLMLRGKNLFSQRFSFSTSLTCFACFTHQFVEYVSIGYNEREGVSKVRRFPDSIRTFLLILSMALVFQPGRCFLGHLFLSIFGIIILFFAKSVLGPEVWLLYTEIWLVSIVLIALAFMSFILSKLYEKNF